MRHPTPKNSFSINDAPKGDFLCATIHDKQGKSCWLRRTYKSNVPAFQSSSSKLVLPKWHLGSISPTFYEQLYPPRSQNCYKDWQLDCLLLHFWDLSTQKQLIEHWWNWHLINRGWQWNPAANWTLQGIFQFLKNEKND